MLENGGILSRNNILKVLWGRKGYTMNIERVPGAVSEAAKHDLNQ